MKPCLEKLEPIALLAARTLNDVERKSVEEHLAACPACREHLEKLQRLCGELERVPGVVDAPELDGSFHRRVRDRVRADAAAPVQPSVFIRIREWFSLPRLGYVAAIVVVIFLALLWAEREQGTGNRVVLNRPVPPAKAVSTPPPTLMALSRALNESELALDSLLARQEQLMAANDPPTIAMGGSERNGIW